MASDIALKIATKLCTAGFETEPRSGVWLKSRDGREFPKEPGWGLQNMADVIDAALSERRCKGCRHWKRSPGKIFGGSYDHPAEHDFGTCGREQVDPDGAWPSDGEASIATGPHFGCIHFEAKP